MGWILGHAHGDSPEPRDAVPTVADSRTGQARHRGRWRREEYSRWVSCEGNAAMAHETLVGPTSELGPGRVLGAGAWAVGNAGGRISR
jgi:hypothetical protein